MKVKWSCFGGFEDVLIILGILIYLLISFEYFVVILKLLRLFLMILGYVLHLNVLRVFCHFVGFRGFYSLREKAILVSWDRVREILFS